MTEIRPRKRVFTAALGTETNTFSNIPCSRTSFEVDLLQRREGSHLVEHYFAGPLRLWRKEAENSGFEVIESVAAFAQPAGRVKQSVWTELRDMLVADLRAAMPVDMVLLHLHGAMIAEATDDCEGELLEIVRDIVGKDVVVGVELDLHCHLTERMLDASTAIVLYKEYPHTDVLPRAEDLYRICAGALQGTVRPVMAMTDCAILGLWRTSRQPMRGFVDELMASEGSNGILSLSFAHSFVWADIDDLGSRFLVVADGDQALAQATSDHYARRIWDMRTQTQDKYLNVDQAMALMSAPSGGMSVFADVSDNAGFGAASDATHILAAMLDTGIERAIIGSFWDPLAVQFCFAAGIGAEIDLRLGGKTSRHSGQPVDIRAQVLGLCQGSSQPFGGGMVPLGDAALIKVGGLHIVLNSIRSQVFDPKMFTQFALDLADFATVVVKSGQHFYASFAPIAERIHLVAAPGVASPDLSALVLRGRGSQLWPMGRRSIGATDALE